MTVCEKKITRQHKAKLSKAQRKEFRAAMWEFRRDPKSLTDADRQKLEKLFQQLPRLRRLYEIRVRFKDIFDTATDAKKAHMALLELLLDAIEEFPEVDAFMKTYEAHQEKILAYFAEGHTSAAVEGINNKARVIIKRCYGLKSADSLWTRLFLDLNWAKNIVQHTIAGLRQLAHGLQAIFSMVCS